MKLNTAIEKALAADNVQDSQVQKAIAYAEKRLSEESEKGQETVTDFDRAWLSTLLFLSKKQNNELLESAAHRLSERQLTDGSWQSSARLQVPFTDDIHPHEYTDWIMDGDRPGQIILDHQRVFTTVTVLNALYQIEVTR